MRVEILDQAELDLIEGYRLGAYFLRNLFDDIDSLRVSAGSHRQPYQHYHRLLSKRFPFGVFYSVRNDVVTSTQF